MAAKKNVLIILAKYPRSTHSKTRLIPNLGATTAGRLSEYFIVDLLRRFTKVADLRIVVVGASADKEEEFWGLFDKHEISQEPIEIFIPKAGSMMGDIAAAYSHILQNDERVILTATDTPYFSIEMLNGLIAHLDNYDFVFYPNVDGAAGHYGMRRLLDLFSDLSTTSLDLWLQRITSLKISYKVLMPIFDIDRYSDLTTFYQWQLFLEDSGQAEFLCPETLTFLKTLLG